MPVYLVGCGKTKLDHAAPAAELYTGNLFRAARAYAEARGDRWFVLSALHGLVEPSATLEPYNVRLSDLTRQERAAWGRRVIEALKREVGTDVELVFLAGADYCDAVTTPELPNPYWKPLAGMGIGHRLAWFKKSS